MMGRLNHDQRQLFYSFSLERSPGSQDRCGSRPVVHAQLAPHYPNNGRPSIDPELMIRMLIIG